MTHGLPDSIANGFTGLRQGARALRLIESETKNKVLKTLAEKLSKSQGELLRANQEDVARLPDTALDSFRDRLTLNPSRIAAIVESLNQVAALPDPVGEVVEDRTLKNGLRLRRIRSPLGVLFMIFESRPNVVTEAFSLAFKTGNAIALRGGSDSKSSQKVLYRLIREALRENKVDERCFFGLDDYDRAHIEKLLLRKDWIDVVIPRGGDKLIQFVDETALMPIIKNDRGLCHAFIDNEADLKMAVAIVKNAKTQRPGVCNSLETVLVHREIAEEFFIQLGKETPSLTYHCDTESEKFMAQTGRSSLALDTHWDTEYLDLILNCRIVSDFNEAVEHIERHGSKHSETIITKSEKKARLFQNEVDAAAVYWNASTRFTDGFEFGLGGELGISTQKLHVRGPVGLRELTTPRWVIDGNGQVRN